MAVVPTTAATPATTVEPIEHHVPRLADLAMITVVFELTDIESSAVYFQNYFNALAEMWGKEPSQFEAEIGVEKGDSLLTKIQKAYQHVSGKRTFEEVKDAVSQVKRFGAFEMFIKDRCADLWFVCEHSFSDTPRYRFFTPEIRNLYNTLSPSPREFRAAFNAYLDRRGAQVTHLDVSSISPLCLREVDQLVNLSSLTLREVQKRDVLKLFKSVLGSKQLKHLALVEGTLSTLPEGLTQLQNLEGLSLFGNRFTACPEEVSQLPHLKKLILSANPIERISPWMSRLEELYLESIPVRAFSQVLPSLSETRVIMNYEAYEELSKIMDFKEERSWYRDAFSGIPVPRITPVAASSVSRPEEETTEPSGQKGKEGVDSSESSAPVAASSVSRPEEETTETTTFPEEALIPQQIEIVSKASTWVMATWIMMQTLRGQGG